MSPSPDTDYPPSCCFGSLTPSLTPGLVASQLLTGFLPSHKTSDDPCEPQYCVTLESFEYDRI